MILSHFTLLLFLPILLSLKYIVKFNIQYKKIFISLFPFLYSLCPAHTGPFPSSTNTTKKDSLINVQIIVSCRMGSVLGWRVTFWRCHLESPAHLGLHSQHRATDGCSRNPGSVTHDHECANNTSAKFFLKVEESRWFGLIICKLGLQPRNLVLFLSFWKDLMFVYGTCAGSPSSHRYLGAGQCEDIVNLLIFIALNNFNWKRNLEINIFLSSEENILKAMQQTEQTYHYYVLSHDITRISLGLEK